MSLPKINNKFEAQYFRSHGIHEVPNPDGSDPDHIASFPTWDALEEGLKGNLPSRGRIITPEYAGAPDDLGELRTTDPKEMTEEMRRRLGIIKELSRATEAEIHYGTPYRARVSEPGKQPREVWHNSVLTLRGGNVTGMTHKDKESLLPLEYQAGIQPSPSRMRTIRNGAAVLICAELFSYLQSSNPDPRLKDPAIDTILASTMWATPSSSRFAPSPDAVERAGGADAYYKGALDISVNKILARRLPNVDRVVVSDRGMPETAGKDRLEPFNAVYTRIKDDESGRRAA